MGPYKPLRTWVEFPIPYYMEISWELIDPIAHMGTLEFRKRATFPSNPFGVFDKNIWVFPKIGGKPPKWMVKIMEKPMNKWDDLGGNYTPIFGSTVQHPFWPKHDHPTHSKR